MAIRRRADWGDTGALPAEGLVVRTDAEASRALHAALAAGEDPPAVGLLGGDLCATLGGRRDEARLRSPEATRVVVDAVEVRLDGAPAQHAVAHVVLRRSWWRGRVVALMNAAWVGSWNVAPRAHPGDGRLEVLDADLPLADRWKARSRLPLGTHVPHPGIATSRTAHTVIELGRPFDVWLDGEKAGRARRVEVAVLADVLPVVV
jgi:diacylglycerol kinase family enzyme